MRFNLNEEMFSKSILSALMASNLQMKIRAMIWKEAFLLPLQM